MTEDTIEMSESSAAISEMDKRDTNVKKAVVAYLMWHSGEVLSKSNYPTREARADRIDQLGEEAISRTTCEAEILADERRRLASQSIFHQARVARDVAATQIVCYLDATLIRSGAMIPVFNLNGDEWDLTVPSEVREMGFFFRDFDDFKQKYEDFGTYLITDPMTVLHMLEHLQDSFLHLAITNYRELSTFHTITPHWNIVGISDDHLRTFDDRHRVYDTGKTIKLRGQVSEVADGMTSYTKIAFRCRSFIVHNGEKTDRRCNTINLEPQNPEEGGVLKPSECIACKGKDFIKLDSEKSRLEPVQRIQLQEIDIGEEPKVMMVELRGNLVGSIRAGSTVEVTGILRLDPISKNSLMSTVYILASSIRVVSEETYTLALTEEDAEHILTYRDSMPFEARMEHVHNSWIGHLLCDPMLKAAIVLQNFGAPKETTFGHRSGIHIMIAGDPGTAKSHLLRAAASLSSGGRYVVAENLTQAGLTGACSQIEDLYTGKKRWSIVPGALALTPKEGICAVDEFNLYKGDFGDFNNALESGFVTINKIVKGTVATECSVIAGANPNAGHRKKFIQGQDYVEQLKLDITVLQRFDAIFVIIDQASEELDEAIALSMLGVSSSGGSAKLDVDFIKKYIALGKTVDPEMTNEAARYIAGQHVKKRQASKSSDYMRSHRQVASLKRFSLAAARFDLSPVVTIEHVKFAENILANTLNEMDPGAVLGAGAKESRERRADFARQMLSVIHENNALDSVHPDFIHKWVSDAGLDLDKNEVKRYMEEFAKNNAVTNVKRNSDGTFTYDGSRNPNTLQHW